MDAYVIHSRYFSEERQERPEKLRLIIHIVNYLYKYTHNYIHFCEQFLGDILSRASGTYTSIDDPFNSVWDAPSIIFVVVQWRKDVCFFLNVYINLFVILFSDYQFKTWLEILGEVYTAIFFLNYVSGKNIIVMNFSCYSQSFLQYWLIKVVKGAWRFYFDKEKCACGITRIKL